MFSCVVPSLFLFLEIVMVLTLIQSGLKSHAFPKKMCALNVNLSLCVSLCACMHITVYMRVYLCLVFFCFNVSFVFFAVMLHPLM